MEEYTHPLLDKVSSLRVKFSNPAYDGDVAQIDAWEKDIKDLVARETLAEDPGIQEMVKGYKAEIESFESDLKTKDSTTLNDAQRDRMIDKITLYRSFADRFNLAQIRAGLADVDKALSDNLEGVH